MGEHDQIFKRAFRVPEHAAGELSAVLPKEVFEAIDPGSLELVQGDFVGSALDERFTDALFKARFRGVPGHVHFLIEHKSEPELFTVLQVLEYLARFWLELLRREPHRERLPPTVCVVVHHGERGWSAPTRLHELVEGIAQISELRELVPDFRILVDDLVQQSDEALKQRPLGVFPKVVLWVLRDARATRRFYEHLAAWSEELGRLSREAPEDAVTVMRYVWTVVGDESFESIHQRIIEVAPAAEEPMATVAEQLIQRGKSEGKREGKAEGKAESVLTILETRGLAVSAEQRARIVHEKDPSELERWLRRAVTAGSVAELFAD
jgi:predicted transposase YdaD